MKQNMLFWTLLCFGYCNRTLPSKKSVKDTKSGNVFNRSSPTTNTADRNRQKIFSSSFLSLYSNSPIMFITQTDTNWLQDWNLLSLNYSKFNKTTLLKIVQKHFPHFTYIDWSFFDIIRSNEEASVGILSFWWQLRFFPRKNMKHLLQDHQPWWLPCKTVNACLIKHGENIHNWAFFQCKV